MTSALSAGLVVVLGIVATRLAAHHARRVQQRAAQLAALEADGSAPERLLAGFVAQARELANRPGALARRVAPVAAGSALVSVVTRSLAAVGVVGLGVGACEVAAWRHRVRSSRAFDLAVPRFADGIARSLRSGTSLTTAVWDGADSVGAPIAIGVAAVRRRVTAGDTLARSLDAWASRHSSRDLSTLVTVCAIGAEAGGRMAQTFEACAASMRSRREVEAELRAMSSQARASAIMLAVLPFGVAAFMSMLDPGVERFLLRSTGGIACLVAAVVLDGVAVLWMRTIAAGVW